MPQPTVTVLMPVHNGERYLKEAIESILAQTFADFEFLVIDDGSTDRSRQIVESYGNPRIVLVANADNRGTVHVLNQGIALAKGRYIARMDADDISLPERLERQVRFMDEHSEVGVSGAGMRVLKKGKLKNTMMLPTGDQELKIQLLFSTCLYHPTVIIRTELAKAHPYPDNLVYTQDYNYWTRLAPLARFANIDEILLHFREHEGQISTRKADLQITNARALRTEYLKRLAGEVSDEQLAIHHAIAENRNDIDLEQAKAWLEELVGTNDATGMFDAEIFRREMGRKWWLVCRKNTGHGKATLRVYRSSFLQPLYRPEIKKYLKFLLRCMTKSVKIS
ncbi:glycosyltransferase family 2 protein [Chlorobaculum sp. 24CR]|uniref:glycosyltransferase family 2 protein n=1 Tax=Chlorobaculum sp. 24CR TaxID=2508878 RepID=UPI00100C2857|nr:glycosyltransferase family A protein [Chlorobaculum sp. 24CR]RXK88723.1 glycosyltransferase family 2 protein [Chlorobaculum sp. 24CR]